MSVRVYRTLQDSTGVSVSLTAQQLQRSYRLYRDSGRHLCSQQGIHNIKSQVTESRRSQHSK